MKDAYSFHLNQESLQETYEVMYQTYTNIFNRLGLTFRAVLADSGNIGGSRSHEFHVLAESGEDAIAYSTTGNYAANIEMVPAPLPIGKRPAPQSTEFKAIDTPNQHSIEEVSQFLGVNPSQCVKTLIVQGEEDNLVALVLRGDHTLNAIKAAKNPKISEPLRFASAEQVREATGCDVGSLGPVGLNLPILVDHNAAHLVDFVCGANKNGQHLINVNWGRDLPEPECADLRNVETGESSPDGEGNLAIARGIEVGHIFQLGDKYSKAMNTVVLDEKGKTVVLTMGCYGIGVSRVVAAAIEQNHDEKGIIWPEAIAPFSVVILPMNRHKSQRVSDLADDLYQKLQEKQIDVLLDDRKERPGVMFADMELIGIPHWLVIGERGLDKGFIEYKNRQTQKSQNIPINQTFEFILNQCKA